MFLYYYLVPENVPARICKLYRNNEGSRGQQAGPALYQLMRIWLVKTTWQPN